jgi:hypothetical protein
MRAFARLAIANFEDRMLAHLNRSFAAQCKQLGEAASREAIRAGVKSAAAYGIDCEVDVCQYIDLSFVFGGNFDRLPWVARILNDSSLLDGTDKIDELYDEALAHGRLSGEDNDRLGVG